MLSRYLAYLVLLAWMKFWHDVLLAINEVVAEGFTYLSLMPCSSLKASNSSLTLSIFSFLTVNSSSFA